MNDTVTSFLEKGYRNKLIITKKLKDFDISVTNIGLEFGMILKRKESSKYISLIADEKLKALLNRNIKIHERFGKYIALTNFGILFEPELKIDILGIIKGFSQNNALFLDWPGEWDGDLLFYLTKEKGKKIPLKGISHLKV